MEKQIAEQIIRSMNETAESREGQEADVCAFKTGILAGLSEALLAFGFKFKKVDGKFVLA